MPLLDYESIRPWAKAIKQAVIARTMPPWFADPSIGHFANDRSLPESAIETISKWVDAGAPEGAASQDEIARKFVDGWTIGKPALIFEMPTAAAIPATGTQPYQYEIVPTHFERDSWVRLAEARAGDREHTHYILISVRESGPPWLRRDPIGVPFMTRPGDDDAFASAGEFLTGCGPGSVPEMPLPGQAKLIKAGSDLVFQLHYTTNGTASTDRSRVGLILAKETPRERVLMLAAANIRFQIPPGEPDFIIEARIKLYQDSTLVCIRTRPWCRFCRTCTCAGSHSSSRQSIQVGEKKHCCEFRTTISIGNSPIIWIRPSAAGWNCDGVRGPLRQFGEQCAQPRSKQEGALWRSKLGRNEDWLLRGCRRSGTGCARNPGASVAFHFRELSNPEIGIKLLCNLCETNGVQWRL